MPASDDNDAYLLFEKIVGDDDVTSFEEAFSRLTELDEFDYSSLASDAASGGGEVLSAWLRRGLSPGFKDGKDSLLVTAARKGTIQSIQLLLDHGAPLDGSVLVAAAYSGKLENVKLLVEAGADIDHGNPGYPTPLGTAKFFGYAEIAAYLESVGATRLVGEGAVERTTCTAQLWPGPEQDLEMLEATVAARRTFRYFVRELQWEKRRIVPTLELAAVKVSLVDPPAEGESDAPEHLWMADVDTNGKLVWGTILNEPNWLESVAAGDVVELPIGAITDWLYAIEGRAYGGWTVNVMRSRMSARELRQHDAAWGFDFGDPFDVRVVPTEGSGKTRGLLSKLFGSKTEAPVASPAASPDEEHPLALAMLPSLVEHLDASPDHVRACDLRGWTVLHQLALAGSTAGVATVLERGADPRAVTPEGMTALDLARAMGWSEVEALLERAVS